MHLCGSVSAHCTPTHLPADMYHLQNASQTKQSKNPPKKGGKLHMCNRASELCALSQMS